MKLELLIDNLKYIDNLQIVKEDSFPVKVKYNEGNSYQIDSDGNVNSVE